jgi:hypothetical protein
MRGTLVRGMRLSFYTPSLRYTVWRSRAPHHSCLRRDIRRLTHVGCCGLSGQDALSVAPAVIADRVSDIVRPDDIKKIRRDVLTQRVAPYTDSGPPDFSTNGQSTPQGNCCPSRSESERS